MKLRSIYRRMALPLLAVIAVGAVMAIAGTARVTPGIADGTAAVGVKAAAPAETPGCAGSCACCDAEKATCRTECAGCLEDGACVKEKCDCCDDAASTGCGMKQGCAAAPKMGACGMERRGHCGK